MHEMEAIAYGLLEMAKEFDIPIVALSQLNRQVESRDDKRPRMSDIRDSGAIEQAADVVVGLYRDEVYNPGKEPGVAELIVLKSKETATGIVKVKFVPENMRFEDLDDGYDR